MTRSQRCEPGWTPEEMAARQDADPDIGPIMRWKRAPLGGHLAGVTRGQGAIAPVGTVIPGRRGTTLTVPRVGRTGMAAPVGRSGGSPRQSSSAIHGGMIGAHLGTARTLALAEHGFYWPGMRDDVSWICNECDCAMLKKRRG